MRRVYKWKPSKAQRKEFAQKMANDPDFAKKYYQRKKQRADKRRATSRFDYATAGGYYIPTKAQYYAAFELINNNPSEEQREACNHIFHGFTCNSRIHHDYIHVINEYIRSKNII